MVNFKEKIKTLNKNGMYHKIIHLPEQIYKTYNEAIVQNLDKGRNYKKAKRIVICGMGGSAISGDLFKAVFYKDYPIEVVKDYEIPFIDEKTLVIAISYSGNTAETLSVLKKAENQTSMIAAITSDGKLKNLVKERYPWVLLKKGYPPRAAIGMIFFSLLKLTEKLGLIKNQDLAAKRVTANLMHKAGALAESVDTDFNIAKQAAEQIKNKIPLIYSSEPLFSPLAYRWKCQLNENAKYPAFNHSFSEMNHNEIEGWENTDFHKTFIPIFLLRFNSKDHYNSRMEIFKRLVAKNNVEYMEFYSEGKSEIEEIFSLLYLGDMISYYLAIAVDVDPTTIDYIKYLKENLKH